MRSKLNLQVYGVHFCLRKIYDYEIDRSIAYALSKYHKMTTSQRKLKQIIESDEYLGRIIHEKTYRYHLKKMLDAGHIYKNQEKAAQWVPGKSLPICLSSEILDQIKLGNLVIQYNENDRLHTLSYPKFKRHINQEEKRLNKELKISAIYYVIMRVISIETPYSHLRPNDFSISDIIKRRLEGHAFWYRDLDKYRALVDDCIKRLQEENILKCTKFSTGEEPRYELVDPSWKDFVIDCEELLENTTMHRLHLIWYNFHRPYPEERTYYESCWGEKGIDLHMDRIYTNNNRESSKRRHKSAMRKFRSKRKHSYDKDKEDETDRLLRLLDNVIVKNVEGFKQKYYNLFKLHPYLYNLIIKMVCPAFIQKAAKRTISNPKNKNKKYLPFLQAHVKDPLDPNSGKERITIRRTE